MFTEFLFLKNLLTSVVPMHTKPGFWIFQIMKLLMRLLTCFVVSPDAVQVLRAGAADGADGWFSDTVLPLAEPSATTFVAACATVAGAMPTAAGASAAVAPSA